MIPGQQDSWYEGSMPDSEPSCETRLNIAQAQDRALFGPPGGALALKQHPSHPFLCASQFLQKTHVTTCVFCKNQEAHKRRVAGRLLQHWQGNFPPSCISPQPQLDFYLISHLVPLRCAAWLAGTSQLGVCGLRRLGFSPAPICCTLGSIGVGVGAAGEEADADATLGHARWLGWAAWLNFGGFFKSGTHLSA